MLQRQTIYVEPTWKKEAEDAFAFTSFIDGYVDADDVERLCESHPEIAAVVVTSPTYEGVISDIAQIARVAHAHHVRVIVDEAHGAHLPFLNRNILRSAWVPMSLYRVCTRHFQR